MADWGPKGVLKPPKASRSTRDPDDESPHTGITLERTSSSQSLSNSGAKNADGSRSSGSFGRMALNSVMGPFSSLSLSRTSTNTSLSSCMTADDKEKENRGRSITKRIFSTTSPDPQRERSGSVSRTRSPSPFTFMRFRSRELSPTPQPLPLAPFDTETPDPLNAHVLPRTAYADEPESGEETAACEETDDDGWSDYELFDPLTESNTEKNASIPPAETAVGNEGDPDADADVDPDPTGEGVNVLVPPEPYFPTTLNAESFSLRGKPKRKRTKHHVPPKLVTSKAMFERDRCTIAITQGDPEDKLGRRRRRTYVVASDISDESRYAVEWGIGTVLRDGDEMLIVTIVENESRVDPVSPQTSDPTVKLRCQQERQALAYILLRQATGLLQRTKLNVTIVCQAWHAKNARHMLLDIVDYYEPAMLIVGSRGLGQLKGILLGSTSHYLIEKCSVPVMVARRRLRRPPRRSAHLAKNRTHVSLAEAGIDRVVPKADHDVQVMLDEVEKGDDRDRLLAAEAEMMEEMEGDDEIPPGVKVAG